MNKKTILYIALTLTMFATGSSLIMSEVLGWLPCVLCWYQRIMLYPMVIIFAVAVVKEISNLEYIIWPMTIIGGLIAFYHSLLQYGLIAEEWGPCVNGVSCVTTYNLWFDFITVPLLSLLTFTAVGILMSIYRKVK